MGVHGLWRLLLPIGRRISLETLEGKVLAIDASIWLTQFLKALRDPLTGKSQPAAHLIGFVRRLCRLYFHGIRPVLVFDGATPEIKRLEILRRQRKREQFARSVSDDGMKRLARRILAQNLQKVSDQKKIESKSGFAPGFDPGNQTNNNTIQKLKDSPHKTHAKDAKKTSAEDEAAILAAIREDLDADEAKQRESSMLNDWDDPLNVDEEHEVDNHAENDDQDEVVEYEDFGLKQTKIRPKTQISLKYISSLPPNKRKDVVEEAKKSQRIQSRREFMPAAGQPDQFSSVQLQNFLKSSRFNLDLVKMAKEEVKLNNKYGGDLMASDRTTRISLVREEPQQARTSTIPCQDDSLFQKKSKKRKWDYTFTKRDSSDEEDQIAWQDAEAGAPSSSQKRRVLMDSDSDEDEMVDMQQKARDSYSAGKHAQYDLPKTSDMEIPHAAATGGGLNCGSKAQNRPAVDDLQGVGFLSDDFGGGGFLHSMGETERAEAVMRETEGGREGGFLRNDKAISNTDTKWHVEVDDSADEGVQFRFSGKSERHISTLGIANSSGGFEEDKCTKRRVSRSATTTTIPDTSKDEAIAREMADALLAEALQLEQDYDEVKESHDIIDADGESTEDKLDVPRVLEKKQQGTLRNVNADLNDDEEEEEVDWEDGDATQTSAGGDTEHVVTNGECRGIEEARSGDPEKNITKYASTAQKDSIEVMSQESDGETASRRISKDSATHERAKHVVDTKASNRTGDAESDEDVEWVDEENAEETSSIELHTNRECALGYPAPFGSDQIVEASTNQSMTSSSDETATNDADAFGSSIAKERADGLLFDDVARRHGWETGDMKWSLAVEGVSPSKAREMDESILQIDASRRVGDDTAAAFARAEATAANLASWAGRAFRRAMRETDNGADGKAEASRNQVDSSNVEQQARLSLLKGEIKQNPRAVAVPADSAGTTVQFQQMNHLPPNKKETKESFTWLHNIDYSKETTTRMLEEYEEKWTNERNQRERDGDAVTDEMKEEAMLLLRLFGVPYVESPAEAEAQCAVLEQLGLVDGIVTEDSDVFVFGGKKVYKNIFDERLYTEAYMADDAEREMGLGRNAMVALAMLLGCDYTEGVKGVGIVNAMEVLRAFDVSEDLKEGLKGFRTWLDGFDPVDWKPEESTAIENSPRKTFHAKHRSARSRWVAPDYFPADNVINAFINPVVDKSGERFSWGNPDIEGIVAFCSRHIGWPEEDTRRLLEPVVNRSGNRYRQTRLDSFMRYDDGIKFADIKSKRLRAVLEQQSQEKANPPNNA